MTKTIGVVGAGVVGRLLAWQLARAGHAVTLFDMDVICKASEDGIAAAYTAAGMLSPISEADSAEAPIVEMGLQALRLWPDLVDLIQEDVDFYQNGSLILSHPSDRANLVEFRQRVDATLQQNGLKSQDFVRYISGEGICQYEPDLAERFPEGSYIPGESWLSSQKLMATLAKQLLKFNCKFVEKTEVSRLAPHRVESDVQQWKFDLVCDCRGLGAKPDISNLRGVRGETILLHAPEVSIRHLIRFMHPRYRIYIVPRANHHYVIGATQIESDSQAPITVRSALELLSAAYAVHPGFAEANILDARVNCRPALPDNLPHIDNAPGLIRINGLFRHGFLLSPAIIEQVLPLISEQLSDNVSAVV